MLRILVGGLRTSVVPSRRRVVVDWNLFEGYDRSKLVFVLFPYHPRQHCVLLVNITVNTYEVSYWSVPMSNLYVGKNVMRASE